LFKIRKVWVKHRSKGKCQFIIRHKSDPFTTLAIF
jgi:hypothetical protein